MADHVHRGHRQAGAVGEHPDVAVELDELQTAVGKARALEFRHARLRRRRRREVALAEGGGIVEVSLQSSATTTAVAEHARAD